MEKEQELSTISPALRAKSKEELLAIIARKDAVELNLRKEILRLKELAKTVECTNVFQSSIHQGNPGIFTKISSLFKRIVEM